MLGPKSVAGYYPVIAFVEALWDCGSAGLHELRQLDLDDKMTHRNDLREQYDEYFSSGLYVRRYPSPNPTALSTILKHLKAGTSALDFGCGSGRYSVPLTQHCRFLVAYDISDEACALTKRGLDDKYGDDCSRFLVTSKLADLSLHAPYDLIICLFGVLSHIAIDSERHDTLMLLRSLLSKTGKLVVSVPNRWRRFYGRQLQSLLQGSDGVSIRYKRPGVSGLMHYHLFSKSSIVSALRNAGLEVVGLATESFFSETVLANSRFASLVDQAVSRHCPADLAYGLIVVARGR